MLTVETPKINKKKYFKKVIIGQMLVHTLFLWCILANSHEDGLDSGCRAGQSSVNETEVFENEWKCPLMNCKNRQFFKRQQNRLTVFEEKN